MFDTNFFIKQLLWINMFLCLHLSSSLAAPFKVALVLDKGGKDDKSFNSAAYEGAKKAEKELGIELKYVEAQDLNSIENMHRNLARKNFPLIIGVGFAQVDAIKKVAAEFPKTNFAVVDGEVSAANIKSLLFEEQEGSFIMGVIAATKSKTGKIGFIGGMDVPLIRRFAMGYSAGVKYANKKAQVIENFIGITGEAWNNPAKAKELTLAQQSKGVDVVFAAAGASGIGVFDAAEEKKIYAIGVDSNQNWMKPGFILTSMLKRVDLAVFDTIKQAQAGTFQAGIQRFGVKDKGVDYALDKHNESILDLATRKKADEAKAKIVDGSIQVPDYYKSHKR